MSLNKNGCDTLARTPNEKQRRAKEAKILDSARLVFCRKGYLDVTMKDIIEECGISRGGIYLYFSSVEEIYREVVARRNKSKFEAVRKSIEENVEFLSLLDSYFATQKERLLHMENSLLRSMYEYLFSREGGDDRAFRSAQLENIRRSVLEILRLGVRQNAIRDENIPVLADHFMFVIEGLSVLALVGGLTEQNLDDQFSLMKSMLRQEGR